MEGMRPGIVALFRTLEKRLCRCSCYCAPALQRMQSRDWFFRTLAPALYAERNQGSR